MRSFGLGCFVACIVAQGLASPGGGPRERPLDTARRLGALPRDVVSLRSAEHRARSLEVTIPARADAPLRLSSAGSFLELVAKDVAPSELSLEDGAAVYHDVAPSTDAMFVATATGLEDLRVLRDPRAPSSARYRLRTSSTIATTTIEGGRLLARDGAGAVRLSADPPIAIDARGVHREAKLSLDGDELVVALDTRGLEHPIVVDPFWQATSKMAVLHVDGTIAPLADGRVLMIGGLSATGIHLSTCELFDPKTNTWSLTGSLATGRTGSTATLLDSGKVLVVGGQYIGDGTQTSSAEVFDPATGTWKSGGHLTVTRSDFTLNVLPSGKALVVGGYAGFTLLSSTEQFDPATSTWSSSVPMPKVRAGHVAARLPSGKLLVAAGVDGGDGTDEVSAKDAVVFDPVASKWTPTGPLVNQRLLTQMEVVGDKAILVGGENVAMDPYSTTELYDPATNAWTAGPPTKVFRSGSALARVSSNRVVIVGGSYYDDAGDPVDLSSAELFDITKGTWTELPSLLSPRDIPRAVQIGDGKVLVSGSSDDTIAQTAEVLTADTKTCTTDAECATGHCADGVCCESACAGQCEACNLPGREGQCSAVTGAPVGGRTACEAGDTTCTKKICDGKKRDACVFPTSACSAKGCVDGTVSRDGVCKEGVCSESPASCGGFACADDMTCRTTCGTSAHCSKGYACDAPSQKCLPASATCDEATNSSVGPDKASTACGAYKCIASSGECGKTCATSEDCAGGAVCEDSKCNPPPSSTGDGGGCGIAQGPTTPITAPLGLLLLLSALSRTRGSSSSRRRE
jgi:hypothetical protein